MTKPLWIFVAVSGFVAVLMGAVAAHWLAASLGVGDIARIEKAAYYQMVHTLALLVIAVAFDRFPTLQFSAYAFIAGILLFSGSLYLYSFTHFVPLVFITPIGGLAFMLGWLLLIRAVY